MLLTLDVLALVLVEVGQGKCLLKSPREEHRLMGIPSGYSLISRVQAALNLIPMATSWAPTCACSGKIHKGLCSYNARTKVGVGYQLQSC
jgi:hypothetical protein